MLINIEKSENEVVDICVNGVNVYSLGKKKDFVSLLQEHRGVTEYNGVVGDIQRWYYGTLVKSAWCATAISYFANMLGLLSDIGGKNSNVYQMYLDCKVNGTGQMFDKNDIPKELKRNDILFWLWKDDVMIDTSSKHVGVCEYDTSSDKIYCIGGNQKDKICTLEYDRKYLYAVYRLK